MTTKGSTGVKIRNYPSLPLEQALTVTRAIQEQAAGHAVDRLTLATLLDRSPSSSGYVDLLLASRAFGLTKGGANAHTFELTELGERATSGDALQEKQAWRDAVLTVAPFKRFLESHNGKRVPAPAAMKAFLVAHASVPEQRAEECADRVLASARAVGLIVNVKGNDYIRLASGDRALASPINDTDNDTSDEVEDNDNVQQDFKALEKISVSPANAPTNGGNEEPPVAPTKPKKVFIAHGKNRRPLEQLKAILDKFGVKYAVALDEAHAGRPISAKVAALMKDECSSAIFIFTADERFVEEDENGNRTEVWRPSENVIYELGAASILYDRRIVIFKEKRVNFPSDYSDLGHISFEEDSLSSQIGDLFSELVALDILEVRAKG